jgi:diaminopimelate epimerase
MDIFNADGGEVEMCGNGIRCLAKYVRDKGLTKKKVIDVDTLSGIIRPRIVGDLVEVDMGEPVLDGERIPVNATGTIINRPLEVNLKKQRPETRLPAEASTKEEGQVTVRMTCVSMGNPHGVIFVDDVDKYPVTDYGPSIEKDSFFPNRVNVEFVEILGRNTLKMRVWERGAGETHACGTGACAAVVASVLNGKTGREVKVQLKGGDLEIRWDEKSDHVTMTGPATTVFVGEIDI